MGMLDDATLALEKSELTRARKFPRVWRNNSRAVQYSGLRNEVFGAPGVLQSMATKMTDSAATVNHSTSKSDIAFDSNRFDDLLETACKGESTDELLLEMRQHLHSHPEAGWTCITEKGNDIVKDALNCDTREEMQHHFGRHTNLTRTISRLTERILNQSVA